jgi:hypothetical protein
MRFWWFEILRRRERKLREKKHCVLRHEMLKNGRETEENRKIKIFKKKAPSSGETTIIKTQ